MKINMSEHIAAHTSSTWRQHTTHYSLPLSPAPAPECLTADGVCLLDIVMEARVHEATDKQRERRRKSWRQVFENKSGTTSLLAYFETENSRTENINIYSICPQ